MRRYLALQAMESGKPLGGTFLGRGGMTYGSGVLLNTDATSSKVGKCTANAFLGGTDGSSLLTIERRTVIHHFACRSLSIGSWRRVGQSAMDLVIFYSPEKCCVTYYINNDSAGYKIEYPFSYIKNISLENGDPTANAEGAAQRPGGLVVELNRPPNFFMDSSGSGGFYQCGDFTEEQQASQILVHHLGGHPKVLSGQLAKLVSLESFQSRHNTYDPNALVVSAPVSPVNHRPASQPNHLVHPHHFPMFQEPFGPSLHPGPRGHKRQRSRSVPVAVDFSMLRHPMPSFLAPPEPTPYVPNPEIFAPVPQHHNSSGPIGPHLSIDTSAGYGMDYRQYPMSATTANSPSEYGTPAFYTSAPTSESIPASNFNTQFGMPFLSPAMVDATGNVSPAVTSMSMGHGDPVIANQSPPLTSIGRGGSTDIYQHGQEFGVPDETISLSELYSKQSLNLPYRSPMDQHPEGVNMEQLDMNNMVSFETIDPSSLSPEQVGIHPPQ